MNFVAEIGAAPPSPLTSKTVCVGDTGSMH